MPLSNSATVADNACADTTNVWFVVMAHSWMSIASTTSKQYTVALHGLDVPGSGDGHGEVSEREAKRSSMCGNRSFESGRMNASVLGTSFESGRMNASVLGTLRDAGEGVKMVGAVGADSGADPGIIFFSFGLDGSDIGAGRFGGGLVLDESCRVWNVHVSVMEDPRQKCNTPVGIPKNSKNAAIAGQ